MLGVAIDLGHSAINFLKLLDGVLQLPIEDSPIGDHNDAIEHRLSICPTEVGKLVGEPSDAVGFAGASAVLDQVIMSAAVGFGVV